MSSKLLLFCIALSQVIIALLLIAFGIDDRWVILVGVTFGVILAAFALAHLPVFTKFLRK